MTAEIVPFPAETARERLLAPLSSAERALALGLAAIMPGYRYDWSLLPPIDPAPAPGLPSAVAAAKAVVAIILRENAGGAA
jgi:hypothetical protein